MKYKKYFSEAKEFNNEILDMFHVNSKSHLYIRNFKSEIILIIETTIKLRSTTGDKLNTRYLLFKYDESSKELDGVLTSKTCKDYETLFAVKKWDEDPTEHEMSAVLQRWINHYRINRSTVKIVKVIYQKENYGIGIDRKEENEIYADWAD